MAVVLALSRKEAPAFDWVVDQLKAPGDVSVASFVLYTLCCFAAQAIGLEAAPGAFATGLILSTAKQAHDIEAALKPLVALFVMVLFMLIGTGMDLSASYPFDPANREGLVVAAFLMAVAMTVKLAAGSSYLSSAPTNRLVVCLGMMPRGEVGLIFLGLGSQVGILSPMIEAVIMLLVIGTTFLAPILLRLVIPSPSLPLFFNSCRFGSGAPLFRWCDRSHHPPWQAARPWARLRRWPWGQAPAL